MSWKKLMLLLIFFQINETYQILILRKKKPYNYWSLEDDEDEPSSSHGMADHSLSKIFENYSPIYIYNVLYKYEKRGFRFYFLMYVLFEKKKNW